MHQRYNPYPLLRALALTSATAGCAAQAAPPQKGPPPVSVTTAKITRGTISTYASFDGQVTPIYQTTLSTAEAGTVAAVNVTEGDFVRKGQILATLDTSQLEASLRANAATVRQDQAQLVHSRIAAPVNSQQYSSAVSTAQQNLAAANNAVRTARAAVTSDNLTQKADATLLAQEYVSRETYEQARSAYISSLETLRSNRQAVLAEQAALQTAITNTNQRGEDQATINQNSAGIEVAQANVELLQAQIAQSSIVAPFDGQVTQRLLDPGAYAGASSGIFEIAQVSRVYVVASVPDVDLSTVALGKSVTFASASLPGRTFHGRVFDINTTPTSGTLSYRVRLLQPNPDLALRGGMFVSVTTLRARATNVLRVPSSAVIGAGAPGATVFAAIDGKAKSMPVRVGLETDAMDQVSGPGLSAGTLVVTAPPSSLHDGSAIAGAGIATPPPAAPGNAH
jgi:RND family efflux transporter MFP subunit